MPHPAFLTPAAWLLGMGLAWAAAPVDGTSGLALLRAMQARKGNMTAVARDLDLAESSVGRWVAEATGTIGSGSGSHRRAADPDSDDQFEMRKRIAELEEENAFLKKAAAFFAREQR